MSSAARARPSAETGNSLIEVVVASALVIVLMLAVLPSLILGGRSVDRATSKASTLDDARAGLARMSREIRSAAAVTASSPQLVDLSTWSGSALVAVRIDCGRPGSQTGTWTCVRTRAGTESVLLVDVRNSDPFRVSANGRYLEIQVEQLPRGQDRPLTMRVGVGLRGCVPADSLLGTCQGAIL